jgi:NADP-dependent aldehyde dehydrogenase
MASGPDRVGVIVERSLSAWPAWRSADRPGALESVAHALEVRRANLIAAVSRETALTPDELAPEFARMVGTLRLFAGLVREGSWRREVVDGPSPAAIGPNHPLRSALVPLGPVAVFGASNFPLAYGVCGGDTASAWAAGCTVVVKEHPAHPHTGRLIVETARAALEQAGAPPDALLYVPNEHVRDHEPARALVRHPGIRAVGFTGSVAGGLAIERLARERETPIPVFAEMGSVNPVLMTPTAARRSAQVGEALASSILARYGQQCTCPGVVFVPASGAAALVERMTARLAAAPTRTMLTPWIRDGYLERCEHVARARGVRVLVDAAGDGAPHAALFEVTLEDWLSEPTLREEIFGPAAVIVRLPGDRTPLDLPLPGSLTCSMWTGGPDDPEAAELARLAASCAGRVVIDGVPTGVRVSPAMVHGGPFPSSNRPDTTAVGPRALERWCRPLCVQGAPSALSSAVLGD